MMQLDLIGTLALSGLFLIAQTLKFPVEAAVLWVTLASIIYVRIRERLTTMWRLDQLQRRINKL